MIKPLIRTFIAISFPEEVVQEIARVQSLVSNKKFIGKLTELENLHLTLKFLGEISQEQLEKVIEQLEKIKFQKFQAKLLNIGLFNYEKSPKIVWIKVGSKSLAHADERSESSQQDAAKEIASNSRAKQFNIYELQKQIDESLKDSFAPEQRFMSHLTIARIKHVSDKKEFTSSIEKIPVKQISFPLTSFKLLSSELKPLGPVYTTIKEFTSSNPC